MNERVGATNSELSWSMGAADNAYRRSLSTNSADGWFWRNRQTVPRVIVLSREVEHDERELGLGMRVVGLSVKTLLHAENVP